MSKSEKAKALRESFSYNKLYIKILVGVFVVLTVCSGFSAIFMAGGGSGQGSGFLSGRNSDEFITKNEYGAYLVDNSRLIHMSADNALYAVDAKDSKNNYSALDFKSLNRSSVVYDGNFYYSHGFKYQLTGASDAIKTEWVSDAVIKKAFPNQTDFWKNAVSFEEYGDNIYFLSSGEKNRLCMISKDGKKAGYVGKIFSSSFLIIDGAIYFFDDGLVSGRDAGLYKADSDGSEFTPIVTGLKYNADDDRRVNSAKLYDNLSFYKGFIYFVDYSSNGDGHICRMRPDGTEYKQISPDRAGTYALNDNILYYYTGSFNKTEGKLYSHEIGSETQKLLTTESDPSYLDSLPIWFKGYIYLKSSDSAKSVKRYNPKSDICEEMTTIKIKNKVQLTWKKV